MSTRESTWHKQGREAGEKAAWRVRERLEQQVSGLQQQVKQKNAEVGKMKQQDKQNWKDIEELNLIINENRATSEQTLWDLDSVKAQIEKLESQ